jgi:hypothetical protein
MGVGGVDGVGAGGAFYLDEWGCSASLPWLLHPGLSTLSQSIVESNPSSRRLLQAATVLASAGKSGMLPDVTADDEGDSNELDFLDSYSPHATSLAPWTFQDRMTVLGGLCEVLKTSEQACSFLTNAHSECQKLHAITSKQRFREADFMKVVKGVAGDEGEWETRGVYCVVCAMLYCTVCCGEGGDRGRR